jgi:hypothetical protein
LFTLCRYSSRIAPLFIRYKRLRDDVIRFSEGNSVQLAALKTEEAYGFLIDLLKSTDFIADVKPPRRWLFGNILEGEVEQEQKQFLEDLREEIAT